MDWPAPHFDFVPPVAEERYETYKPGTHGKLTRDIALQTGLNSSQVARHSTWTAGWTGPFHVTVGREGVQYFVTETGKV